MSEITIFLLYLIAAAALGASRLPSFAAKSRPTFVFAFSLAIIGIGLHSKTLYDLILSGGGFDLSLSNTISMIGLELALIALIATFEPTLRGIGAVLLILAALAASLTGLSDGTAATGELSGQVRVHVLISLFSYGLLTVGAIVAVFALLQERRLRAGSLSAINHFFAPLVTTEKLLFSITAAGFAGLAAAILSGFGFVDNLFAQHLAHKTVFSILALIVFGTLVAGRHFAGWRGVRAIRLYLSGFFLLCLAYFGVRLILEQLLQRSWS